MVLHEPEAPLHGSSPLTRFERRARRWSFGGASELQFHSDRESRAFLAEVGETLRPRTRRVGHGQAFSAAVEVSRAEARRRLGIAAPGLVFLCIGFMGAHKGYDRALRAFAALKAPGARLYVVGSVPEWAPQVSEHVDELRALAGLAEGAAVVERYVDDEEFDVWLQASDTLILPYRSIASSSVVERGRMFGLDLIVSDVGGLPEQAGAAGTVVRDDDELAAAMRAAVARA
jgi:glycosyltransferase involved in cell wall biosynthesis